MWILYQTALALALAVAGPLLLLRRGRHYLPTLRGRLGGYDGDPVVGPLWIHAVSVGEARVSAIMARALPVDWPLLITTVTPTGQQQAVAMSGKRSATAYLPVDLSFAIRRFLDRFSPRALMLVEGDYWPLMLRHVRHRRLPVVVVNGRLSERSFSRLRRFPWFARALFESVDRFVMQTDDDRDRLLELGVEASRISVTGNLKFDAPVPSPAPEVENLFRAAAAGRPMYVAGSTMPGEEELVLGAFARAGGGDNGLLVLAPRHPERWQEAGALVDEAGFELALRTELTPDARPDVVLLDSLGELAALYRLATAAFVGGTLVPTGGHNPLEPAVHGVAVAVGPSMRNFRHMALAFDQAAAWQRVADVSALGEFFALARTDPSALEALGAKARALVAANRGALQRTLEIIEPLLAEVMK
jgi:3-deoxy-D-manno-octulosonic-acid transferase